MLRHLSCLTLLAMPLAAQAPRRLPDVQVTATRVPTEIARTAAAVTVLQGDDLRAQGITTLLEALRLVPGAASVQSGSYGAVASLFLRGGENDFVKVLLDGVPLNLPGGQLNPANIALDDVERIEVVRGPVSVQHGADAMSGVIQIFTRRGQGRLTGEVVVGAGTWGNADLRGAVRGATSGWHGALSGTRFASDGTYPFNNNYLNASGAAVVGYHRDGEGGFTVSAHLGDALARFPTDGGGVPNDINQRVIDADVAVGLTSHRVVSPTLTAHLDGWVHRLDSRLRDPQDALGDTTGFGFAARRDAVVGRHGATGWVEWSPSRAARIQLGATLERETETQHSETRSNFGFGEDVTIGDFAEERTTRSVNGQLLLAPRPELDVHLGVRRDGNSAFDGFTTWRAGLVWRARAGLRTWVAGGNGFKAPTFSELFALSAFEVGNPQLQPERNRSIEAGLAFTWQHASIGLTAFDQEYRDLVQYVSAAPGEPTYANLGAATSRGVEVTASWQPTDLLTLHGQWTMLRTEVADSGAASSVTFAQGERLLRRPDQTLSLAVIARPGRATASLGVFWTGGRDDADFSDFPATRVTLPAYLLVNGAVSLPIASPAGGWPGLAVQVRGENLLDRDYEQVVGFPGRGRTVLAGGRLFW